MAVDGISCFLGPLLILSRFLPFAVFNCENLYAKNARSYFHVEFFTPSRRRDNIRIPQGTERLSV